MKSVHRRPRQKQAVPNTLQVSQIAVGASVVHMYVKLVVSQLQRAAGAARADLQAGSQAGNLKQQKPRSHPTKGESHHALLTTEKDWAVQGSAGDMTPSGFMHEQC